MARGVPLPAARTRDSPHAINRRSIIVENLFEVPHVVELTHACRIGLPLHVVDVDVIDPQEPRDGGDPQLARRLARRPLRR